MPKQQTAEMRECRTAMGHQISAVLLKGPFDLELAKSFDLTVIELPQDIFLFPLDASYCDHWSDQLGISGLRSDRPILNANVIHHMVNKLATQPLFALIETDYFGGCGSQAAAVYRGCAEIMPPATTEIGRESDAIGPINQALQRLGVLSRRGRDEFDTVGLGRYRDFDDLFEKNQPPS